MRTRRFTTKSTKSTKSTQGTQVHHEEHEGDLVPISASLWALAQAVDDTIMAARSDAYRNGLQLYGVAKLLQSRIPGLSEQISPLRDHLDRVVRRTPK